MVFLLHPQFELYPLLTSDAEPQVGLLPTGVFAIAVAYQRTRRRQRTSGPACGTVLLN